ncbi:hypothetical protein QTO34_019605 [Cnephaeus nilssonii]|uniref:Uncharacterized protein n=1 Tax=Cnephaeus nilssonii TaxID=3371016 RepID=A0AA40HWW7_CNENI|nr:hypothetical protein QTO34_019605 [Eptesicus nilssonii]
MARSDWGQRQQWVKAGRRCQRVQEAAAAPIAPQEQGEVEKPSRGNQGWQPLEPADSAKRSGPAPSTGSGCELQLRCQHLWPTLRQHYREIPKCLMGKPRLTEVKYLLNSLVMITSMIPIIKTSSLTIHKGKITATTHKMTV